MSDALYIAATGMEAQQKHINAVSNNIANINTPAFKRDRVAFKDLIVQSMVNTPDATNIERMTMNGREVSSANGILGYTNAQATNFLNSPQPAFNAGVLASGPHKQFVQGELRRTDLPLDIAINGEGFLEVVMPNGDSAYTRAGSLQVTPEGLLATRDGHILKPSIQLPQDAQNIVIERSGKVSVTTPNEKTPIEVGHIELVRFANPSGLQPLGDNLYHAPEAAGVPVVDKPGEEGMGLLSQGFLEASNVKLVDEMMSLLLGQRAYEMNARMVQAADEMMGIANNLRKS